MTLPLVNTDLYPIDRLESADGLRWIEGLREQLGDDGSCTLPDFISPEVRENMVDEVRRITHLAYPGPTEVPPYFFNYRLGEGENLSPDHPLRRKGKRNLAQVATDLIPLEFLLSQLHRSEMMANFLGALLQQPIYRNCDPYQSLNISVMDEGGCQQWHFDGGNMVTTLLLQEPEDGGVFEYAPAIRCEDNENFDEVQAVLDGRSDRVREIRLRAGTLSLFRGHYSLHRVTPVIGKTQRLQAILGYSTQPDFYGSLESSILHYGPRVAEIEARSPQYPVKVAND